MPHRGIGAICRSLVNIGAILTKCKMIAQMLFFTKSLTVKG